MIPCEARFFYELGDFLARTDGLIEPFRGMGGWYVGLRSERLLRDRALFSDLTQRTLSALIRPLEADIAYLIQHKAPLARIRELINKVAFYTQLLAIQKRYNMVARCVVYGGQCFINTRIDRDCREHCLNTDWTDSNLNSELCFNRANDYTQKHILNLERRHNPPALTFRANAWRQVVPMPVYAPNYWRVTFRFDDAGHVINDGPAMEVQAVDGPEIAERLEDDPN